MGSFTRCRQSDSRAVGQDRESEPYLCQRGPFHLSGVFDGEVHDERVGRVVLDDQMRSGVRGRYEQAATAAQVGCE